jgi:hypothetical protein
MLFYGPKQTYISAVVRSIARAGVWAYRQGCCTSCTQQQLAANTSLRATTIDHNARQTTEQGNSSSEVRVPALLEERCL